MNQLENADLLNMPKILKPIWKLGLRRLEEALLRDRLRPSIHVFENADTGIIFIKEHISVFTCPVPLKNSLYEFLEGYSTVVACERNGVSENAFHNLLLFLLKKIGTNPERAKRESEKSGDKVLERLVLNVSHSCNLRCRYCYAGGGNYGKAQSLMDEKTAAVVLDTFYDLFDHIENIQFFGGEPFLNMETTAFICQDLQKRYRSGAVKKLPHFGVVTNGTLLSTEIVRLIKDYNLGVTVSIDGPEDIHDYLRGRGTYKKICRFIQALNKERIDFGIESTYTSYHLESGVTLNDLLEFFSTRFNSSETHIPPVALSPGDSLALDGDSEKTAYRAAVEFSVDNLLKKGAPSISFAGRLMKSYTEGSPITHYCPAGFSTLSVDNLGNVYPCFMFTGYDEFNLGNVLDPGFPDPSKTEPVTRVLFEHNTKKSPECSACWASPLCSGCIGADYFKNGGTFEKKSCAVMRSMVEGFLSKIVDFMGNKKTGISMGIPEKGGDSTQDSMDCLTL